MSEEKKQEEMKDATDGVGDYMNLYVQALLTRIDALIKESVDLQVRYSLTADQARKKDGEIAKLNEELSEKNTEIELLKTMPTENKPARKTATKKSGS